MGLWDLLVGAVDPAGSSESGVVSGRRLESASVEGDTPVRENLSPPGGDPK